MPIAISKEMRTTIIQELSKVTGMQRRDEKVFAQFDTITLAADASNRKLLITFCREGRTVGETTTSIPSFAAGDSIDIEGIAGEFELIID